MSPSNISSSASDTPGWETTSSTSITPTSLLSSAEQSSASREVVHPPVLPARPSILDEYWIERAKFIEHLEKRAKKFVKRSKEDYDAARWGKPRPKRTSRAAPTPRVAQDSPPTPPEDTNDIGHSSDSNKMFASTSALGALRVATAMPTLMRPAPVLMRSFASSTISLRDKKPRKREKKKKQEDVHSVSLVEAARILRALEIEKPRAALVLTMKLKQLKGGAKLNLRGRCVLPHDHRGNVGKILVFAEKGSLSARLAREAGVDYIGDQDLFEAVLNEEIKPTKILATPSMMPSVTARLARFLGPKGLMPTARRGGIGQDEELVERIQDARGALDWIISEDGWIRLSIARTSFELPMVEANVRTFLESVRKAMNPSSGTSITEEHLVSRRNQKKTKAATDIDIIELQSTNGPCIPLKDV